jgi:uncharacterized protein (TIGR03437 family)
LQVDPWDPDRIFINNYGGGNFLSEDGGVTWEVASKGYTGAQLHDIDVHPGDHRRVYTIGRSGLFRSEHLGEDWEGLYYMPRDFAEWYAIALDPSNPQRVLCSDEHQGILLWSADGGRQWSVQFVHPEVMADDFHRQHGFKDIAFAPSNPSVVYAGMRRERRNIAEGRADPSFGVYKSTGGGQEWEEANDVNTADRNINALAVDYSSEDIVYAGTVKGGIFRTLNGGQTWRSLNNGLAVLDVRALAIDPQDPKVLYAGAEGGGIYKTTDGGAIWVQSSNGLDPQASIRDIVLDPTGPQIVYAADVMTGVYRSEDGGQLWVSINRGLRTRAVKALAISSDGSTLYAATEGEGVFRLDVKAPAVKPLIIVSAASYIQGGALAPESIASAWGQELTTATASPTGTSLPTILADTSITLTDSAGTSHLCPLFFVSPGQINLLVPAGSAKGDATVDVTHRHQFVASGEVRIDTVSPGLFSANADGRGVAAAVAVRVAADGSQTHQLVFECGATPGSCVGRPIDLGAESDQVILLLFGTGIRGFSELSAINVKIDGVDAEVLGAAAQSQYVGLDQVNVRLLGELAGRGEVDIELTVDGKVANVVTVHVL